MRRFKVWVNCHRAGSDASEEIVELPDTATNEECEKECSDCLDTLIANEFDMGWNEIGADEE